MPGQLHDAWGEIASWGNLVEAHHLARRGKRRTPEVARFDLNWEWEIARLEEELRDLAWQPGPFRQFTIYESKVRLISAAPYRDRVVHQAIMNILGPHLERSFIFDTYACRLGKGTEAARERALWDAEEKVRGFAEKPLRLKLHDNPRLAPASEGVSFLGMRIFRNHRFLLPPSGYRFRRRMKGALRAYRAGRLPVETLRAQAMGWLGHAGLANAVALQRAIWKDANGRCPGARTA